MRSPWLVTRLPDRHIDCVLDRFNPEGRAHTCGLGVLAVGSIGSHSRSGSSIKKCNVAGPSTEQSWGRWRIGGNINWA
jgi:hypothetical protein